MFEIIANKSIGPYILGEDIQKYLKDIEEYEVHLIGGDYSGGYSGYMYCFNNIRLDCDENEKIKGIIIGCYEEVTYKGVKLSNKKHCSRILADVSKELIAKGVEVEEDEIGLWINEASFGVINYEDFVSGVEMYIK